MWFELLFVLLACVAGYLFLWLQRLRRQVQLQGAVATLRVVSDAPPGWAAAATPAVAPPSMPPYQPQTPAFETPQPYQQPLFFAQPAAMPIPPPSQQPVSTPAMMMMPPPPPVEPVAARTPLPSLAAMPPPARRAVRLPTLDKVVCVVGGAPSSNGRSSFVFPQEVK